MHAGPVQERRHLPLGRPDPVQGYPGHHGGWSRRVRELWRREEAEAGEIHTHEDDDRERVCELHRHEEAEAGEIHTQGRRQRARPQQIRCTWQRARLGLAMGSIGLASVFFVFFQTINRGGHPNLPATVNRLTVVGKLARCGKAMISRGL